MVAGDPHDLGRFVTAQTPVVDRVMAELGRGRKATHWMWFVFPQLAGLGHSAMAQRYAIQSRAEAEAYLAHPVLGPRLQECVRLTLQAGAPTAHSIFGEPDTTKFRSCLSLFAAVTPPGSVFAQALDRFYGGQADDTTRQLLEAAEEAAPRAD